MNHDQMNELEELLTAFGITPEWDIENIKETAMNRHCVKLSKRHHVKRILDEAFSLLKEQYNIQKSIHKAP